MQIVGHCVVVLYLVKSLGSGIIVLVEELCQSSSVAQCVAEVALSLSVVALSDVQSTDSSLYVLRVSALRDGALSILYVAVDERYEAEVSLCLRSLATELCSLGSIFLSSLLVTLGKSKSSEVVECTVVVRMNLSGLLVDFLLLSRSLVESSRVEQLVNAQLSSVVLVLILDLLV